VIIRLRLEAHAEKGAAVTKPNVSVIVPTHNGARWLAETLTSVLQQHFQPCEILVINDGSTDETVQVLRSFESRTVRVIHQLQGGIGAARNRGVAEASGAYLAFLDHDDLWTPDKLARQMAFANQHSDLDVIYTDAEEFNDQGVVHPSFLDLFPRLRSPAQIFQAIVHFSVPLMSSVLLRAEFLRTNEISFCERASGVDDVGLFLEIAATNGRFGFLNERLTRRRLHDGNLSKVHRHRFEKRIVLYQYLVQRLADPAPAQRRALEWGLRHAHWTVGECQWGEFDREAARVHFARAIGLDWLGIKAILYGTVAWLPAGLVQRLQQAKRALATRSM
jgi:glycosyltransferase involved in cell wall biosynthesis